MRFSFPKFGIRRKNNIGTPPRRLNLKKLIPLLVLAAFAAFAVYIIFSAIIRRATGSSANTRDERVVIAGPKSVQEINQEFSYPLTDSKGKTLTDVKFLLENAELRDEIIVKGQRAVAVQGRTFLILTVKITSTFSRALEINAKDYFRLTVNDKSEELLAPEIHNDPVVIQPTSTKYTRVGFPINDSDKNLKLYVGEIEGEKTTVELTVQ